MKSKPAWLCITIADYLLNRRSLCKDFNSCFELFVLLVRGRIKIRNKELVSESALFHKANMEKRKTQEEKQDKNIAETRDYILFRAFA